MLVKPAPGRVVRDPNDPARVLDPDAAFPLPEDQGWQRLYHVFGDLVPAPPPAPAPATQDKGV